MLTLDKILAATLFTDLFVDGTKKELRQLLKQTHPDLHPNDKDKAEKAFVHVNLIWTKRNDPTPTKAGSSHTAASTIPDDTIITKKHSYLISKPRRANNGVNFYDATYDAGQTKVNLVIATHPKISTALIEGTKNLKIIRAAIPADYIEFFPETLDAFHIQQDKGVKFSGIAQPSTKEFYSLAEVAEDYPKGISAKDVAWMYRRMLVALGNTHDAGYAHGAPTKDAFLIYPETHSLVLTNWQFSQELGRNVSMVTADIKKYYEDDRKITAKKDLQIASAAAAGLLHETSPKRIRVFLNGMSRYPTNDARQALQEFDSLLKELYGERLFHPFRMRRNSA